MFVVGALIISENVEQILQLCGCFLKPEMKFVIFREKNKFSLYWNSWLKLYNQVKKVVNNNV